MRLKVRRDISDKKGLKRDMMGGTVTRSEIVLGHLETPTWPLFHCFGTQTWLS